VSGVGVGHQVPRPIPYIPGIRQTGKGLTSQRTPGCKCQLNHHMLPAGLLAGGWQVATCSRAGPGPSAAQVRRDATCKGCYRAGHGWLAWHKMLPGGACYRAGQLLLRS
jgi:hypothetical protein